MEEDRTLIVSVNDYSFDQAMNRGFYACPASYGRGDCDYIAFYRGKPVSAITHYARVTNELVDPDFLTQIDRIRMFPEHMDEPATALMLGDLSELETPVESDGGHGVQGAMYRTLDRIRSADTVTDLQ